MAPPSGPLFSLSPAALTDLAESPVLVGPELLVPFLCFLPELSELLLRWGLVFRDVEVNGPEVGVFVGGSDPVVARVPGRAESRDLEQNAGVILTRDSANLQCRKLNSPEERPALVSFERTTVNITDQHYAKHVHHGRRNSATPSCKTRSQPELCTRCKINSKCSKTRM